MESKLDIVFWRIGLREVYSLDMITPEEFLYMYDRVFMYKEFITHKEASVVEFVTKLISNNDNFAKSIKEEVPFVFGGKIPDDKISFKKHWLFHLAECLEEGSIDEEDFGTLLNGIDFDNTEWTEDEKIKVNTILDMLRIDMLNTIPASMEFFENPSFDLLMFANNMSEAND